MEKVAVFDGCNHQNLYDYIIISNVYDILYSQSPDGAPKTIDSSSHLANEVKRRHR